MMRPGLRLELVMFGCSTGNEGVGQLVYRFFSKCGFVITILPLVAALFFAAGCLEKSPDISKTIPEAQTKSAVLCPSGLQVDFDSDVSSSLFRVKGILTPLGNGSFPYLLLNATLQEDGVKLKSTKYLMIDVKSGGDHGFEIAKNMFIPRGDYSCTLEVSGPTGVLACETKGCKVTEPWTEPSSASAEMPGEVRPSEFVSEFVFEKSNSVSELSDRSMGSSEGEETLKRESGVERSPSRAEEEAAQTDNQVSESSGSKSAVSGSRVSQLRVHVPEEGNVSSDHVGSSARNVAGTLAEKKYDGVKAGMVVEAKRADKNAGIKDTNEKLVGSSSSKKYHRLDCRYAQKIKAENRIYFSSEEDARSQSYLPCKVCNP
jgi:hypothetical protein